jgi:hypothetical protein
VLVDAHLRWTFLSKASSVRSLVIGRGVIARPLRIEPSSTLFGLDATAEISDVHGAINTERLHTDVLETLSKPA